MRRDGFVLPTAVAVMVLLSMVAATGLYSARADLRAAMATRYAAVALVAADAGAVRTLANWSAVAAGLPLPGDSLDLGWTTLPDRSRYRIILFRPPVPPGDPPPSTVVVYSTGVAALPGQARRTVALVVDAPPAMTPLCCEAGARVTGRIRIDGADRNDPVPEIDGTDRVPPGWSAPMCLAPSGDVPGVASSEARRVEIRRNGDVDGAPPVVEDASISPADFTTLGGVGYTGLTQLAGVRFTGNTQVTPAPVVSGGVCDTTDPTNWGAPTAPLSPCGAYRPIIHVAGNLDLRGGVGQGVLLVDGDLRMRNDAVFYGLVVVMGTMSMEDDTRIYGGIMVRGDANGNGRSQIDDRAKIGYSSCAVGVAQAALSGAGAGSGSGVVTREWFEVIR